MAPSMTTSETPPTHVAITGLPAAMASTLTRGDVFVARGEDEESAALEQSRHSLPIASTDELDAVGDPVRGSACLELRPFLTVAGDDQIWGLWMSV